MGQKFSVSFPADLAVKLRKLAHRENVSVSRLLQYYVRVADVIPSSNHERNLSSSLHNKEHHSRANLTNRTTKQIVEKALAGRGFSPAIKFAIRLVLIDGLSQVAAAQACGVQHRQAINRAIRAIGF